MNLAYGSRVSLLELIAVLEEITATSFRVITSRPRKGDVPHSQADRTRLRRLFPEVQPTPLPDGLRATVAWFREAH